MAQGPNPWKVVFLLGELNLNYEIKAFTFSEVKEKPFTDINPNGRVPAIEDPNTNMTLWESGAILQYLIEQYDAEHRLSYTAMKERHLSSQWLHFQMSGQGPYYGQCTWFKYLHPEKNLQSAIDRKVSQWLVSDKMTFVDMAFVPWNSRLIDVLPDSQEDASNVDLHDKLWDKIWEGAPHVRAWHEHRVNLPSWKRSMEIRTRLVAEQGLLAK
ncbi:glutathione S-transferase [Xylariaceae sp. FL1272]|nr:glutathione S-transferase [Xylariaceae sp. FL1272]